MIHKTLLQNVLLGSVAVAFGTSQIIPAARKDGPIVTSAISIARNGTMPMDTLKAAAPNSVAVSRIGTALNAFQSIVRPLSDSRALSDAFKSYFAYKSAHPDQVRKPLLYFVDYGLPSTTARGYVFDMVSLESVYGPCMVAHGRGSSAIQYGVPTHFSNASGSNATSLGLYLAQGTYPFTGHTGGRTYGSIGLKLEGVSAGYNDNALARGVVAHGAPYVTSTKAGRSEGCPAMEPARAQKLLPALSNGAMVFLFAPDQQWMSSDPWVTASSD